MVRFVVGLICALALGLGTAGSGRAQGKSPPKSALPAGTWEGNVNSTVSVRLVLDGSGGEFATLIPDTRTTITSAAVISVKKSGKAYQIVTSVTAAGSSTATRRTYTMTLSPDGKKVTLKSGKESYDLFKVEPRKP